MDLVSQRGTLKDVEEPCQKKMFWAAAKEPRQ
jgi:hypothetical protein